MQSNTRAQFPIHTLESAPPASRPAMERLRASVGMIPNLAAGMSDSPALIESFESIRTLIRSKGTFSPQESEAISLAFAVENGCGYCTAIHATFGLASGLDRASIEAIRSKAAPFEPRLARLVTFARALAASRGWVSDSDLSAFLDGGFTKAQVLELIARLAMSVMANYSGHIIEPTPDEAIRAEYR